MESCEESAYIISVERLLAIGELLSVGRSKLRLSMNAGVNYGEFQPWTTYGGRKGKEHTLY